MSDIRKNLIDLLRRYRPVDDADRMQAERILAFVEKDPRCFQRSNAAGHVTGSAWVVDAAGRRVLLTHHRKLNRWLQLGGHADGDGDVLAVALREAREESGLHDIFAVDEEIFDLDVHEIPATKTEPAHFHFDIRFALRAPGEGKFSVSGESFNLAWAEVERIGDFSREESMLRMARKWISKQIALAS